MVYRKPWSFRVGVLIFGSVAFLAATGRSFGWDTARNGPDRPSVPSAPVVLDAASKS